MKKQFLIFLITFITFSFSYNIDNINIFIGTNNTDKISHGNVYPCIGTPYSDHYITYETTETFGNEYFLYSE